MNHAPARFVEGVHALRDLKVRHRDGNERVGPHGRAHHLKPGVQHRGEVRPREALRPKRVPRPGHPLDGPVRAAVLEPQGGAPAVVLLVVGVVGDLDADGLGVFVSGSVALFDSVVGDAVLLDAVFFPASGLLLRRRPEGDPAAEHVRADRLRRGISRHETRLEDRLFARRRLHQPPPLHHPEGRVGLEHAAHTRHIRELGRPRLVSDQRQPTGAGDDRSALDVVIVHGVPAPVLSEVNRQRRRRRRQPPLGDGFGDWGQHLSPGEVTGRGLTAREEHLKRLSRRLVGDCLGQRVHREDVVGGGVRSNLVAHRSGSRGLKGGEIGCTRAHLALLTPPGEGLEHHERDGGGSLDKVRGTHHGAILHAVPVRLEVPEAPLDLLRAHAVAVDVDHLVRPAVKGEPAALLTRGSRHVALHETAAVLWPVRLFVLGKISAPILVINVLNISKDGERERRVRPRDDHVAGLRVERGGDPRKRPRPRVRLDDAPPREAVRRSHVPGEHHGAVLGGPVAVDELVGDVIVRVLVHLDGDGLGAERGASEG